MSKGKEPEYLDLVDEGDNVIGRERRDIIYSQGLSNYRVVNVFVVNHNGDILLPKRDSTRKIFPNCFDFSCGEHVLSGESYEEAAVRGLKEELGFTGTNLIPLGKFTPSDGVSSFMTIFKVVYKKEGCPDIKEGVASLSFVPLAKINQMIEKNPEVFKADFPKVIKFLERRL